MLHQAVFPEFVTDVPHRLNEDVGRVLNLASESSDMDIHRPVPTIVIIAPDFIE